MNVVSLPDSILLRIVLEHFKKASSTFSPVRALVSKNINSVIKIITKIIKIWITVFISQFQGFDWLSSVMVYG